MTYQIYLVTNKINNKKYVGQTKTEIGYLKRFNNHCCEEPGKNVFHRALRKYGVDNFRVELLEDNVSEDLIDDREMYYIKYYNTFYKNNQGYNMTYGGQGVHGYNHIDETKNKISKSSKKYWENLKLNNPDEYKRLCDLRSENLKNKPFSEEHKQHIKDSIQKQKELGTYVNAFKGRKHSEKTIQHLRSAHKGRAVIALDIETNQVVKEFASLHDARRYLVDIGNIPEKNSSACGRIAVVCCGKGIQAYGFKWKWKD